jgi:hypothetical protein
VIISLNKTNQLGSIIEKQCVGFEVLKLRILFSRISGCKGADVLSIENLTLGLGTFDVEACNHKATLGSAAHVRANNTDIDLVRISVFLTKEISKE